MPTVITVDDGGGRVVVVDHSPGRTALIVSDGNGHGPGFATRVTVLLSPALCRVLSTALLANPYPAPEESR